MCATTEARRDAGASPRKIALLNPACFACGPQNAGGLRVAFHASPQGITARWTPAHAWEGFQEVIHGGIIATVLDEAMSQAVISRGWEAFTAELRVRYRRQVSPGDELSIRGWVVRKQKRMILAEASLNTPSGEERAHGWGIFLVPPGGRH